MNPEIGLMSLTLDGLYLSHTTIAANNIEREARNHSRHCVGIDNQHSFMCMCPAVFCGSNACLQTLFMGVYYIKSHLERPVKRICS